MTDIVAELIAKLRQALPPVFLGSKLNEYMGQSIAWGTVQNKRSRREIKNESEIFIRSGNRVLVARDPFLSWWATTLSEARRPPGMMPTRRGRRTKAEALVAGIGDPVVSDEVSGKPAPRISRRRSAKQTTPTVAEADA